MLLSLRTAAEPTDKALLARHAQGDRSAFGVLYDRYAAGLLFFARSLTGEGALAEDLLQDCFLRLLHLDPTTLQHDCLKNLLYTILRNLVRDEGRRRFTRLKSYPLLAPKTAAGKDTGRYEKLSLALHALPEDQREVITLKFFGGLTFADISVLSGAPEATVKSRYRYAVDKLADLMKEET